MVLFGLSLVAIAAVSASTDPVCKLEPRSNRFDDKKA